MTAVTQGKYASNSGFGTRVAKKVLVDRVSLQGLSTAQVRIPFDQPPRDRLSASRWRRSP